MCTAAVGHCVGRGNGSVLVTGVKMAQQLEKATTNTYCLEEQWFGNHFNPCYNHFLKLAPQHCLPRVRSFLRLRGAAGRPGRNRRLRAHLETRSQMPILRPVNSRGIRSARNIMNYEIDRFDTRRTISRRAMRTPPGKIGISCHQDTGQRCLLGSITRSMLRRPVRPGHELRMSSPSLGLPRPFFIGKKIGLHAQTFLPNLLQPEGVSREEVMQVDGLVRLLLRLLRTVGWQRAIGCAGQLSGSALSCVGTTD